MSTDIALNYGDVLKAYQAKSSDLLTQLTTAEARLIASANLISELQTRIEELEQENEKLQKASNKNKKNLINNSTDTVVDCNQ